MKNYSQNYNNNNKNYDDDYVYDIDFEKYVDKLVNSDYENDKKSSLNIIITEKEFFDNDHIHNSFNNIKNIYNKGNIYTNRNILNRNNLNRNYVNRNNLNRNNFNQNNLNRNYLERNNNVEKIVKKVRFSDEIKIINDDINIFTQESPKSIVVNFKECNDDVRIKKFNDFVPKGKYVFSSK